MFPTFVTNKTFFAVVRFMIFFSIKYSFHFSELRFKISRKIYVKNFLAKCQLSTYSYILLLQSLFCAHVINLKTLFYTCRYYIHKSHKWVNIIQNKKFFFFLNEKCSSNINFYRLPNDLLNKNFGWSSSAFSERKKN